MDKNNYTLEDLKHMGFKYVGRFGLYSYLYLNQEQKKIYLFGEIGVKDQTLLRLEHEFNHDKVTDCYKKF